MVYFNKFGRNSWITINYNKNEDCYWGKKLVNKKCVGEAMGKNWKQFFIHLTMLGLSDGERCEFSDNE